MGNVLWGAVLCVGIIGIIYCVMSYKREQEITWMIENIPDGGMYEKSTGKFYTEEEMLEKMRSEWTAEKQRQYELELADQLENLAHGIRNNEAEVYELEYGCGEDSIAKRVIIDYRWKNKDTYIDRID